MVSNLLVKDSLVIAVQSSVSEHSGILPEIECLRMAFSSEIASQV